MKRDMDLIRAILLEREGETCQDMSAWSEALKAYHVALILDAKLAEGATFPDEEGVPVSGVLTRLTWQGHEFLDVMRDDTIWRSVREKVLMPTASWTFGLLIEYAKSEIRTRLNI